MSNPPNIPTYDSHEEVHELCVLLTKHSYVRGTKAEIEYDWFSSRYYVKDHINGTVTVTIAWDTFQAVKFFLNIEKELDLYYDDVRIVKEYALKTDYEIENKDYPQRQMYYRMMYQHLEERYKRC